MYYLQLYEYQSDGETMGAVRVMGWVDISTIKILSVGSRGGRIGSSRPIIATVA